MPVRHCVTDIETTGFFRPEHKIIEIAAVEMIDYIETGRTFRTLINPRRSIPQEATDVHGIVDADVAAAPLFRTAIKGFKEFVGDGIIVWHNGKSFDGPFIDRECRDCGEPILTNETVDTLIVARKQFPGAKASLDALADRFNVDRSARTVHGALIDCQLLGRVFFFLMGMDKLDLSRKDVSVALDVAAVIVDLIPPEARQSWFARRPAVTISADEVAAHAKFLEGISDAVWNSIGNPSTA